MAYQAGDTWRWNGTTWVTIPTHALITVRAGDLYVRASAIPQFNTPQGTAFPVPNLGFAVNDEAHYLARMPASYIGGNLIWEATWYAAATSGNVNLEVALCAVTPGSAQSILTKAYPSGIAAQSAVNSNTNAPTMTSGTLTGAALDGVAAGDLISIRLRRIAASVSEMAGDALVMTLSLR